MSQAEYESMCEACMVDMAGCAWGARLMRMSNLIDGGGLRLDLGGSETRDDDWNISGSHRYR